MYYPDETVVDATGARFVRAAALILPEWLISSAIDHSDLDGIPLGFPRKTLLARLGAVNIDANLTLNEDEDEQEREVFTIITRLHHNEHISNSTTYLISELGSKNENISYFKDWSSLL